MNTKKDGELALRRVTQASQELSNQITTLELTKQAIQREADVKADMFGKARAEYEEKLTNHENEKDSLRKSSRQATDMANQTQKKLEMQIAALELDVTKKQQEADEW